MPGYLNYAKLNTFTTFLIASLHLLVAFKMANGSSVVDPRSVIREPASTSF
jgi:hypothetical protein